MLPLHRVVLLFLAAVAVQGQIDIPFKVRPGAHEENRERVGRMHREEVQRFAGDTNLLVLPGLVANRTKRRVEVRVERSAVGAEAPCEFLVVNEGSDHGYESLLIAFARPSDVHNALRFIGVEPGQSHHPPTHRYWAKGEPFLLSVLFTNREPIRVESLLVDRRTGTTLPPEGFLFTGSRSVAAAEVAGSLHYVADRYQPMAIASLFNTPYAVLEVPRTASKESVYRNTVVNPGVPIPEGTLLTLVIEPVHPPGTSGFRDLALDVDAASDAGKRSGSNVEALAKLRVALREEGTVLNPDGSLVGMVGSIAALDRQSRIPFLTLRWSPEVRLGSARALAEILDSLDRERGIRIEPPRAGDPYYRAFMPDRKLLDRRERRQHPMELTVSEAEGGLSGRLVLVESVWKEGIARSELEFGEALVRNRADLARELAADRDRPRTQGKQPRPNVLLVFVSPEVTMGQFKEFLEPVLTNHTEIHVFLDETMPPIPRKPPAP